MAPEKAKRSKLELPGLDLGSSYCSWLQALSRNAQLMMTFSERHMCNGLPSLARWGERGKEEFCTIKGTHKQRWHQHL